MAVLPPSTWTKRGGEQAQPATQGSRTRAAAGEQSRPSGQAAWRQSALE